MVVAGILQLEVRGGPFKASIGILEAYLLIDAFFHLRHLLEYLNPYFLIQELSISYWLISRQYMKNQPITCLDLS